MSGHHPRTIFLAAIGLERPDRAAYLDQACGDDAALRSEVEKLLAEDDRQQKRQQDGQQDGRHDHATTPVQPGSSEAPKMIGLDVGDSIDGFKILEEIGEGGMGVVYLAEQVTPVKRRIALKVIKPGMDSKAVLARFEAERQALALMDHPGIARVLQAGTTDRGLPYFAMEYVKGIPITEAADQHQLDTAQRIQLMQKVCNAVQHAHMKGIIHRDLKPSNVLVTTDANDDLVAKIIDFGVAKATTQQLTELTVHTQVGHFIGTPAYMSPEQADLTAADIDTRTDVYSLGVILYELLAGQLPFDPAELRDAGLEEMRRKIREDDPPKPSTRLTSLDEKTATRISKARRTRLDQLQKSLASELDWIPLKALRKLRSERYATPNDLSRDLQRYLDGEPLEAGPESTGYRLRKFVKRRRIPIAVGGAFAAILVMATAVSGWLAVDASRARAIAVEAKEAADAERQRADEALASQKKQTEIEQKLRKDSQEQEKNIRQLEDDLGKADKERLQIDRKHADEMDDAVEAARIAGAEDAENYVKANAANTVRGLVGRQFFRKKIFHLQPELEGGDPGIALLNLFLKNIEPASYRRDGFEVARNQLLLSLKDRYLFKGMADNLRAVLRQEDEWIGPEREDMTDDEMVRLESKREMMRQTESYPLMWSGHYEQLRDLWKNDLDRIELKRLVFISQEMMGEVKAVQQAIGWTGAAHLREGNAEEAKVCLNLYLDLNPDSPWGHGQLAEVHALLGDEASARQSIEAWKRTRSMPEEWRQWSFQSEDFSEIASLIAQVESIGQAMIRLGEEVEAIEMMRDSRERLSTILGWDHPRFNLINEWLEDAGIETPVPQPVVEE